MDEQEKLEKLQKLNDYFSENLDISFEQLLGFTSILEKDVMVNMDVKPKNHYTLVYPIKVNKGTIIKIVGPKLERFQPLGYSNYLSIVILNPQTELGELSVVMEDLVDSIK